MSPVSEQQKAIPVGAATCLLLFGITSDHALLAVVCATVVFLGLDLRNRPARRVLGNAVALSGVLAFCAGLLFATGYSLGKDMAHRDAGTAGSAIHAPRF
jgi:hypothetical protein